MSDPFDPSWPWRVWDPLDLAERLGGDISWAVAGGLALDLHFERRNEHEDTDVAVARHDASRLQAALAEFAWAGKRWDSSSPFTITETRPDVDQIWAYKPGVRSWWLDIFLEPWDDGRWQIGDVNIAVSEAIERTQQGVPYLAPEIVLFFKAETAWHPKCKRDLPWALSLLRTETARAQRFCDARRIRLDGPEWRELVSDRSA